MSPEAVMLEQLRQTPVDDERWLLYADWLGSVAQEEKARHIRLMVEADKCAKAAGGEILAGWWRYVLLGIAAPRLDFEVLQRAVIDPVEAQSVEVPSIARLPQITIRRTRLFLQRDQEFPESERMRLSAAEEMVEVVSPPSPR